MEIVQEFSFGFKDELIFVDDLSLNDVREEEVIAIQDVELSEEAYVDDDASKEGFTSNESQDLHSDIYEKSPLKTHECSHCSRMFTTRAKMLKHYRIYHQENVQISYDGKRSWICSQCQKQFVSRKGWIIHQRSHSDERPYSCLTCGKTFIDSSTLLKHQVIHQAVRPFTCHMCGHGFNQKVALQRHEKTHNQLQEFGCGFCPKTFLGKCSLQAHEKLHSGVKPFQCKYCSGSFHTVTALKQHKRVHMIEQPPTCLHCKKPFTNLDTLLEHMEIHTTLPNLQCPVCPMSFNMRITLRKHIRVHVSRGNVRFCNLCQLVFHSKQETIVHFDKHIKVGTRNLGGKVIGDCGSGIKEPDNDIGRIRYEDKVDLKEDRYKIRKKDEGDDGINEDGEIYFEDCKREVSTDVEMKDLGKSDIKMENNFEGSQICCTDSIMKISGEIMDDSERNKKPSNGEENTTSTYLNASNCSNYDNVKSFKDCTTNDSSTKISVKDLEKYNIKIASNCYNNVNHLIGSIPNVPDLEKNVYENNFTKKIIHNIDVEEDGNMKDKIVKNEVNDGVIDTHNIVSEKENKSSTNKGENNGNSSRNNVYYASNVVGEHKNSDQSMNSVEELEHKCEILKETCNDSTFKDGIVVESEQRAMEESLIGDRNGEIVQESMGELNGMGFQVNDSYRLINMGLVEDYSKYKSMEGARNEVRVGEIVQESMGESKGLVFQDTNLMQKNMVLVENWSKHRVIEGVSKGKIGQDGMGESKGTAFQDTNDMQKSMGLVEYCSKPRSMEGARIGEIKQENMGESDYSLDTNYRQKSLGLVEYCSKPRSMEGARIGEIKQENMGESDYFQDTNYRQNNAGFSGLEALCDVAVSAAKELNQELTSEKESPKNKSSPTPLLNGIRFFCKSCNRTYPSTVDFRKHKCSLSSVKNRWTSVGESGKLFACKECSKSFRSKNGLLIHQRSHTGERPYACRWCEKAFGDSGTRHKHERIHTGERPFQCNHCPRAFNQRAALRAHQVTHEVCFTRSHTCKLCPSSFSYFANLRRHVVVCHRDYNAVPCPLCTLPKTLHYDTTSLEEHVETAHWTPGDELKCLICDHKEFGDVSDYCNHILGHAKRAGKARLNNNDCIKREDFVDVDC